MKLITCILILVCVCSASAAEFPFEMYKQSSIHDVVALYTPVIDEFCKKPDITKPVSYYDTVPPKLRLNVICTGRLREITTEHKQYLSAWARTQSSKEAKAFADLFGHEILISEQNIEIWVPIQSTLIAAIQQEVQREQNCSVYALFIGWRDGDWKFMVNGFQRR